MSGNRSRRVVHVEGGRPLLERVRWCDTFACKLRGLTFRWRLSEGEGLALVEKGESRVGPSITMVFTFIDLGVIWLDGQNRIVDTVLARPWRLSYVPKVAARLALETHPDVLEQVKLGDELQFLPLATGE